MVSPKVGDRFLQFARLQRRVLDNASQVGAQRYLDELGLPIDTFAASSSGSLAAAMQAMGLHSTAAVELLTQWLRGGYRQLLRFRLSRPAIF